jgi:hypothetical protein
MPIATALAFHAARRLMLLARVGKLNSPSSPATTMVMRASTRVKPWRFI